MKKIETVHSFEKIKLLADPRRMEILRLLMASPASLTQLARALKQSPAWIRHHVLALESAGLVEGGGIRKTGRVTEKLYRARADALLLQELILPRTKKPPVIFSGSHDLALEGMAERLQKHLTLLSLPVGSLDGLVSLRQGLCQLSGAHLLDQTGEYNVPFIRRLFPDRPAEIVTLAHRTQGLILAAGNPAQIKNIADLVNPKVRFVNRNPGSGTRLWLDTKLRRLGLSPGSIQGYDRSVSTHSEAASAVQSGQADAALGLQEAAARRGLHFIPLFQERYDLVLLPENEQLLRPLLEYVQTAAFRAELNALTGYDSRHSGEQIPW